MSDIPPWIGEPLYPLTHFLGYRPANSNWQCPRWLKRLRSGKWAESVERVAHTFVATWVSIVLLALMSQGAAFKERHVPVVIAAFGAEAVLMFVSFNGPQAQPRCIILGNALCAILGVGVTKLFALSGRLSLSQPLNGVGWASAATVLAVALTACQILDLTHPPGGATALLAAANPEINALGWWLVPVMLSSSVIMIGWACIINNVGRRTYPQYWISPTLARKIQESRKQADSPTQTQNQEKERDEVSDKTVKTETV